VPVVPVDLCEWVEGERPPGQPTPDGRLQLPPLSSNGFHPPEAAR
jgi:hypothetical protein